ncbi:unnamed protein product, partial [Iphiclides podalirius]
MAALVGPRSVPREGRAVTQSVHVNCIIYGFFNMAGPSRALGVPLESKYNGHLARGSVRSASVGYERHSSPLDGRGRNCIGGECVPAVVSTSRVYP